MTPVVRLLLILNVAVFGLQQLTQDELMTHFALWPLGQFELWQLVSSAFLHANLPHIALNMYALYMFGGMVERVLGSRRFTWLYGASVLTAAGVQLAVVTAATSAGAEATPTVGASGGVFGVLLAFAMLFPHSRVYIIPLPFPLKAWVMVTVYAVIELTSGVMGTFQGVAHFAHLGGMLGAAIVMFAIGYQKRVQPAGDLRGR